MRLKHILGIPLLMAALAQSNVAVAQSPEVIFDPTLMAPDVQIGGGSSDISVDSAGRIHFKSQDVISRYFARWVAQDDALLSRPDLMRRVLGLAYGDSWVQTAPTALDINRYRRDLNTKIWWLAIPTVTAGATNVVGATVNLAAPPSPPAISSNTSIQAVYTFTWKFGESLFARPSTKETAEAHLAAEYKMRNEGLKKLLDIYSTRRTAQIQLRTCMLEYFMVQSSDPVRAKELLKSMDALRTDIIKSSSQLDMIADGAAAAAYSSYVRFIP